MVPDASLNRLIEQIVNKTAVQNFVVRLYTNDYTPVAGSVAGNFTELSGNGYAAITLTASEWVVATQQGDHPSIQFEFTAATGDIYGYYITEATSGLLIDAARFADAPVAPAGAAYLIVTLHLSLDRAA